MDKSAETQGNCLLSSNLKSAIIATKFEGM